MCWVLMRMRSLPLLVRPLREILPGPSPKGIARQTSHGGWLDQILVGNLYMGVKQMGAIEICMFASRLPSIRFSLKIDQTVFVYCPFALPPFSYPCILETSS